MPKRKRKATKATGYLPLDHGHILYYEDHGNPEGKPTLFLHGGPGGGLSQAFTKLFNLQKTRLILYDQRGCGKSTPQGLESLNHNTTWDLVKDIERLRRHLDIEKWYVAGGSWGTTLALAYAETYPSKVTGLLLRGVCLISPSELNFLQERGGASEIFPEFWDAYVKPIGGRPKTAKAYKSLLRNSKTRKSASKTWWNWESSVSFLRPRPDTTTDKEAENLAILENHYFTHNAWLKPNQLLKNAYRLRHIPIDIVQGRYDLICPFRSAYMLHKALPHSKLHEIPDAGHGMMEDGTFKMLKQLIQKQ